MELVSVPNKLFNVELPLKLQLNCTEVEAAPGSYLNANLISCTATEFRSTEHVL